MKIATITCHRAYNYGAVLQAYALQTFLNSKGHEVRVIDYKPAYLRKSSNRLKQVFKTILQLHDRIKSKKVFEDFLNNNISMTDKTYVTYEELETTLEKYDMYIAGSDQVWNMDMRNGKDDSYFLRFASNGAKKISYAASIAMNSLSEQQQKRFQLMLADYEAVSVRESSAEKLLKDIGINCRRVCDPVFLLDKEKWLSLIEPKKHKKKYILVYSFYKQKEIYAHAQKLAKKMDCEVYSVGTKFSDKFENVDKYFWNIAPFDFLELINNAEAVVTNSFHGMSLSMIFNKPLHVFETVTSRNSRLIDMLEYVGAYEPNQKHLTIAQIEDYQEINIKIEELIKYSKSFLEECRV